MYNPPAFRETRPELLHGLIRAARLALLVSAPRDGGVPEATHLPLVLAPEEGPQGTLYGHVAKANPHWRGLAAAGRALAVFPGPETYVSPSLYASKAEHGRVVLRCERLDDANIRLSVSDNGPGVRPEDQQVIFEKFRQVDQSKTRAHQGTGLGLAIARQLTRLLGGEIGVESELGKGATFWVRLPAALPAGMEATMGPMI